MERRAVNKMLTFSVPGVPTPKGRPRMTRRGRVYTPAKTVAYERTVSIVAQEAKSRLGGGMLFEGPVMVTIYCYFALPPSWSRKRKAEMLHQPHAQLPDLDNLVKSVLDGVNNTQYSSPPATNIWIDDKQVAAVAATKHWAEESSVLVRIENIEEGSKHE